ncbi:ABC transporter substrate-binding protein [Leucobacter sp. UCMA 4100]|uniref:ABC transporter substrate-binding protein n=1 Tax=Leucobacter sp. UCMA 4100 TaxID=2810534 RepID=UPI0022EB13F9|nr:ABC transporter substrate-binding protein [Leucobacter sp. UCMA 4100]MDA3147301.1 ABC transporter substrate-binding protein [Leucobacter sp. UCMA 4100]
MERLSHRKTHSIARAAAAVAAVTLAFTLGACSPGDTSSAAKGDSDTLVLGIMGSTKDEIQPYGDASAISNGTLVRQLYNGLTTYDNEGGISYDLAESMEPNETLDVWTVHVREGVTLHNGKEFTADDVVDSIGYIIDPANAFPAATALSMIDPDGVTALDDHTVELKLTKPYGQLPHQFASERVVMRSLEDPTDPDTAVGTGPFTLTSFTAGQEAVLERFDDYWGENANFSKLKLSFFIDQQAITNALLGGQIDIAYSVPFTDVATLEGKDNIDLVVSDSASYMTIAMNNDAEPFNDPKVREAMRLVADRDEIVSNAFGGYATAGNDFYDKKSACPTPENAVRTQDIDRAKALLQESGNENLSVELVTDGAFPGMAEAAQLFAAQAAKAGITVTVKKLDVATFLAKWGEWPFVVAYAGGPYLQVIQTHLLEGGEENTAHFNDPELNALSEELNTTVDEDEQCALITQMQQIEFDRGGYIVPAYSQSITAYRSDRVSGLKEDLFGRTSIQYEGVSVK